ncbi:unnamed protein product [Effrenium voratum]|nr:unnamed protein product [Effrenium voratum]
MENTKLRIAIYSSDLLTSVSGTLRHLSYAVTFEWTMPVDFGTIEFHHWKTHFSPRNNEAIAEERVRTLIQALVNAGADAGGSSRRENLRPAAAAAVNEVNDWPSETRCPLLLAVQCPRPQAIDPSEGRNSAAVAALCEVGARVTPEVLEELKAVSLESQRCEMERLMRPQVQGDPNMRMLGVAQVWVAQFGGKVPLKVWKETFAKVLLREELRHASASPEADPQQQASPEQFEKMQTFSATRRLLMELRQALDEERDPEVSVIQEALRSGADPNAREKEEEESLGLTGLALLAMSYRSSPESVTRSIHALLEAKADLEIEVDDGATPLLVALRHRNMTALEVLAKATAESRMDAPDCSNCCGSGPAPRIVTEILDEVGCLSEDSRRLRVEELLRPVLKGGNGRLAPLPLWTWVEHGSVAAVEALLRSAEATVSVDDVISLQRCRSEKPRQQIEELLRRKCGEEEYARLRTEAATRRLLQELREAFDDQRDVQLSIIQSSLELEADANAQEEETEDGAEFQEGSYSLSALQLLVTNLHVAPETMRLAVACLVEAKAEALRFGFREFSLPLKVNSEMSSETPLLSALQSRCVAGVKALSQHGARVTSDVLEELKTISSSKVRHALEDILEPLIKQDDKRLRCPLWVWVQIGAVASAEALVRNASHDEDEIDIDVLVALQRCRSNAPEKGLEGLNAGKSTHVDSHGWVFP